MYVFFWNNTKEKQSIIYYYVKIDTNKHSNWEQAKKREVLLIAFLIIIWNSV